MTVPLAHGFFLNRPNAAEPALDESAFAVPPHFLGVDAGPDDETDRESDGHSRRVPKLPH